MVATHSAVGVFVHCHALRRCTDVAQQTLLVSLNDTPILERIPLVLALPGISREDVAALVVSVTGCITLPMGGTRRLADAQQ